MIRAVLDTNVLVSAMLSHLGPPARIYHAWRDGERELVSSYSLIEELDVVLRRPTMRENHGMTNAQIADLITLITENATMTPGTIEVEVVKEDPDDNKFLACAAEADAEYIVSGDKHLLTLGHYGDVAIVRPRVFADLLDEERRDK
ncbi:MAG: putative toxin-antitoxin system toxin component, PIN family [Acidobacteria bacterium]|nr:putative toxin-antitoxin system toxin component, PIN family [Acidobacteriota bacterium]